MRYISSALDFISLVREVSLNDIRLQAERVPHIGVLGSDEARFGLLRALGQGAAASGIIDTATFEISRDDEQRLNLADLILAVYAAGEIPRPDDAATLRRIIRTPKPLIVLREAGGSPDAEDIRLPGAEVWLTRIEETEFRRVAVDRILDALDGYHIGLARRLPVFRPSVSQRLIRAAALANAKFAAASNIPALIPLVGTVLAAAGDFIVLTKNQLLLLFKIAAVHGRSLESSADLYLELAPVVGTGLVWRSMARELAGMVPALLGAAPKIAIAYAGTFTVGQAAAFFYNTGRKPPREVVQTYYRDALERLRRGEFPAVRAPWFPLPRRSVARGPAAQ